jgi:stearoyl-CoA desaturase (delta-9 desaturase)
MSSSTPSAATVQDDPSDYDVRWLDSIPFWGVHLLAAAGIAYYGWSWSGFALTMAVYFLMIFAVTGGMHRYFSHRTYKTSRAFQFVLALLGTFTTQKGVLWWAAHHRHHHKYSDMPEDVHSPRQRGFYWSHMGWILVRKHNVVHWDRIKDLSKFPELVFLQKYQMAFVVGWAASFYFGAEALGYSGVHALLWGYFVQQVLCWHGTFTINSFTHIWGRRRYATTDDSKNSLILALVTLGEGWHNNHHYYQRSTSQGFYWWEIDITYYILKGLSFIGLVSGVSRPPRHVRDAHHAAQGEAVEAPAAPAVAEATAPVARV